LKPGSLEVRDQQDAPSWFLLTPFKDLKFKIVNFIIIQARSTGNGDPFDFFFRFRLLGTKNCVS